MNTLFLGPPNVDSVFEDSLNTADKGSDTADKGSNIADKGSDTVDKGSDKFRGSVLVLGSGVG